MNGVDAAAIALGQDFRAIEAGAHAWASRSGTYRPLTTYRLVKARPTPSKLIKYSLFCLIYLFR